LCIAEELANVWESGRLTLMRMGFADEANIGAWVGKRLHLLVDCKKAARMLSGRT
jgi:hypothetical protein